MKNYKMLVAIFLVFLSIVSVYQLFNENISTINKYNDYLKKARYCASVGIVDAYTYYDEALKINKSVDVYVEYVKFCIDQCEYYMAEETAEEMAKVFPGKSESYDLLMEIYDDNSDYVNLFKTYDKAQKKKIFSETINKLYQKNEYRYFSNGRSYQNVKDESNGYYAVCDGKGYWGYTNSVGSIKVGCQYSYAGAFSNQIAPVKNQDNELYYINEEGGKKFVFDVDEKYDYLGQIVDDVYVVGNNGKYAYYNTSFKKLFGDYDYAGAFSCGTAAVKTGNEWYLINRGGQAISQKYDYILLNDNDIACIDNCVIAVRDNIYYILDEKGNEVKKTNYKQIAMPTSDKYIACSNGNKWGFCDRKGELVIDFEYDMAKSFSNGLAAVCKDSKWGYINLDNKVVIDYTFTAAGNYNSSGCTYVSEDNESWYMIKLYKYNHD